MPAITVNEVVDELMRCASNPTAEITKRSGSTYCCYQEVTTTRNWRIMFFIDCGEWDYAEWAESPDGRRSVFDEWVSDLDDLDPAEALQQRDGIAFDTLERYLLDTPIEG